MEKTVIGGVKALDKVNATESVLGAENASLLLTPKEVDEGVKYCAEIVADAINLCFHNTIKEN